MLDATFSAWPDASIAMLWLAMTLAGTLLIAGVHSLIRRILR